MPKSKGRPTTGSKLFGPRDDWWHNAVNYMPGSWDVYAWGYLEGAKVLVRKVKRSRHELDFLIYPIIFLYRQYLELKLKAILKDRGQLKEKDLGRHCLMDLWPRVRKISEEWFPDQDPASDDECQEIIAEFDKLDSTSTVFRYPTDKMGKESLRKDISHINVAQFQERIKRVVDLLEGLAEGISAVRSMEQD